MGFASEVIFFIFAMIFIFILAVGNCDQHERIKKIIAKKNEPSVP